MTKLGYLNLSFSLGHLFLLSNLILGSLSFVYLQRTEALSQIKVWVPSRDLPPYTLIKSTDLIEKPLLSRNIPSESVRELTKLSDRYTVSTITKDKPITKKQLSPELTLEQKKLLQNTVLIGILATPDMILGGNLQAGDQVNILIVLEATEKQPNPPSIQFDNTFIFDIRSNETNSTVITKSSESVVVLAIPADRRAEFSRSISGRKVMLSRKF